jgi:hypothetical protein
MRAVHTAQKQALVGFSLLGITSLWALIHLSLASPLRRSRTIVNCLVGSIKILELCKLIKLSAPEKSDFKGFILKNWELFSDRESLAVMAMVYLVSEAKYLAKLGFKRLKFMVKVKMSLNSRCPMVTKG